MATGPMSAAMVPISLFSDSYKASHYLQYPECQQMVAVRSGTLLFHATCNSARKQTLQRMHADILHHARQQTRTACVGL